LRFRAAKGKRISADIVNRPAAITNEGASLWAKRINKDAVDTAKMPRMSTIKGGN